MRANKVYLFFREDIIARYGSAIIRGKYSQNIYWAENAVREDRTVIKWRSDSFKEKISKADLYKLFTTFEGVIMTALVKDIHEN